MTDSYIGVPPKSGFINTAKQRVTSSTNNYVDLDHAISDLSDVIIWVNSIKQDSTNLTLTNPIKITLGGTLTASDVVEIVYLGKQVATQSPDTGSVTNSMLAGSIDLTSKVTGALPQANIGDQAINEAKLQVSNSPVNGYMLTAQSGNTGGLTWAEAGSGDFIRLSTIDQDLGTSQKIQFTQVFSSDYDFYRLIGRANVGSNQQALIYFRWLNSSNAEQYSAEYHYAGYGRYSSSDDSGGNVSWQKMGESDANLVTDFYGGSYSRTMFYDMTFYPKVNSSQDRSGFQGQISYNAYNSGNGGWNATSVGGTYNMDTDLSGGGLQIECNTSFDYVTMSLYGVKLA